MAEEKNETPTPETEGAETPTTVRQADQAPKHLPPKLRDIFGKVEGAFADRPGFRNKGNAKSKAQRKKKR